MLAFLYLLLSWFTGYFILKKAFPWIYKINSINTLLGKKVKEMTPWLITLPASFLVGNMISTWITYISSYLFHYAFKVPMIFGNIVAFIYLVSLSTYFVIKSKSDMKDKISDIRQRGILESLSGHKFGIYMVFILTAFYAFFFYAYLHITDGNFIFGNAVTFDLQFHCAISRTFSLGSNFPTEYPYFTNGRMNYHFLFQFLVGNLEFLGIRLDYAYNIMSTLSMVSFLMLLCAFTILLTGKKWVGVLVNVFFIFRSSFAIFTFSAGFKSLAELINGIIHVGDYIGKTNCESWGIWTQNVYMGQRHFAFSLGIMMFIFITVFPYFKKMILQLRRVSKTSIPEEKRIAVLKARARLWFKEFVFTADAWMPKNIGRSFIIGSILGLVGFWNGAVLMTLLPMLFIIAIMSKHRLDFLNIALVSFALFLIQYFFFLGLSNQGLSPKVYLGFLAEKPEIISIIKYYVEVLGIMPFVLIFGLFVAPKGSRWLTLAFLVPLVMATTIQFTLGNIAGFNHKLVNIAVLLLNIVPAYAIYWIFTRKKAVFKVISIILIVLMTVSGVVDTIAVHNKGGLVQKVIVPVNDSLTSWIIKETDRNSIFLTHKHSYLHPVVKAGRKMFFAFETFSCISGYKTDERELIYKKILLAVDEKETRELIKKNKISYLLIDNDLRKAYNLNEDFFKSKFPLVYSDSESTVYKLF